MPRHNRMSKLQGFSLVELMAAVAIVAILVSLALPRFRLFIARSRMAEAKTNLGIIATLQQSYHAEYQKYANLTSMGYTGNCGSSTDGAEKKNELGFRVVSCEDLLYNYNSSGGTTSFTAKANSNGSTIYPECTGKHDEWSINQKRKLKHDKNILKECHE